MPQQIVQTLTPMDQFFVPKRKRKKVEDDEDVYKTAFPKVHFGTWAGKTGNYKVEKLANQG